MPANKVALVAQRYGLEVNGGAEFHCRLIAEHLSKYCEVEVLTTCAIDYTTWKNDYPEGVETLNGVQIRRFPVDYERDVLKFNKFSEKIFGKIHNYEDEIEWMKLQGPYSTKFLNYIKNTKDDYTCFIFFTYLYCTTFFGLPLVKEKALLVPTAHDEPPIYLSIFNSLFNCPRKFIYNTEEEKNFVISKFRVSNIPSDVVGVGIDIPDKIDTASFVQKYNLDNFIVYVGRVEESKGCQELFDYFLRYKKEKKSSIKLALMGKQIMKIPQNPDIISLGFVTEQDKFNGIKSAKLLIMPSKYESLSMVLLESWLCNTPVLVNGKCDVLKGQCIRGNAGLYYENYEEFEACLDILLASDEMRNAMGKNGMKFVLQNYSWENIEKKYISILQQIENKH
ncbi:glycosyltransferase family 4 protein [Methanosarcina sp. UBA411]|jgi:glycosyltransferase involved in cell wall biosynthesis|uniref:glycosyltransferase family 4 protein n=1 Tax=Methanosarcina sp. UBA411 TaxID=1915589 RepID=UPI0025E7D394|nr:glycosyltransferase [Methanosarcina sp. UBA411]